METLEAIHNRRSVRAYTSDPVGEAEIESLLKAAMAAPSSENSQPWHFVVIQDKEKLRAVSQANKWASMAEKAAVGILVCAELSLEKSPGWWGIDCSAAIQNMLLAATDIGLGAVWTGVYPDAALMAVARTMFNLPEGVNPHSLVFMGWPKVEAKRKDRYKPERVHHNVWQG